MIGGICDRDQPSGRCNDDDLRELASDLQAINLFTPHGWALQAFALTARDSDVNELFVSVGVALAFGLICLSIGMITAGYVLLAERRSRTLTRLLTTSLTRAEVIAGHHWLCSRSGLGNCCCSRSSASSPSA